MLGNGVSDSSTVPVLTLVIGDKKRWDAEGRILPVIDGYTFADISDLTPALVEQIGPAVILSALVTRDSDATEIARQLKTMGFTGSYRVLTTSVPDTDLIREEVAEIAPALDFDIIDLTAIFPGL